METEVGARAMFESVYDLQRMHYVYTNHPPLFDPHHLPTQ
jgi:hypothetical protein